VSPAAAPCVHVRVLLPALSAYTLECAPHTLQSVVLAVTTVVHTCSSRSLQEESKVNLAIVVCAVVQSLAIAEAYAYHMPVAD